MQQWIVIGDIHGDIGNLKLIPEISSSSGLIISGDLTNYGHMQDAKNIIETIKQENNQLPVFAQMGNMDYKDINSWLEENKFNLHNHVIMINSDIAIFGIGGSTITPMDTPTEFTEAQYSEWLANEWKNAKSSLHTILISHNPPKNSKCDRIDNGLHVGSEAVRNFIEEYQPDICICGHIHESKGMDKIGKTIIINPGMLADGGYVVITYADNKLSGELKQISIQDHHKI